jgi:hypothetical protein
MDRTITLVRLIFYGSLLGAVLFASTLMTSFDARFRMVGRGSSETEVLWLLGEPIRREPWTDEPFGIPLGMRFLFGGAPSPDIVWVYHRQRADGVTEELALRFHGGRVVSAYRQEPRNDSRAGQALP